MKSSEKAARARRAAHVCEEGSHGVQYLDAGWDYQTLRSRPEKGWRAAIVSGLHESPGFGASPRQRKRARHFAAAAARLRAEMLHRVSRMGRASRRNPPARECRTMDSGRRPPRAKAAGGGGSLQRLQRWRRRRSRWRYSDRVARRVILSVMACGVAGPGGQVPPSPQADMVGGIRGQAQWRA